MEAVPKSLRGFAERDQHTVGTVDCGARQFQNTPQPDDCDTSARYFAGAQIALSARRPGAQGLDDQMSLARLNRDAGYIRHDDAWRRMGLGENPLCLQGSQANNDCVHAYLYQQPGDIT